MGEGKKNGGVRERMREEGREEGDRKEGVVGSEEGKEC